MAEIGYILHNLKRRPMNALDLDLIRKAAREIPHRAPTPFPEPMTVLQLARRTVIFTVDAAGIASLMDGHVRIFLV